MVLQAKIKNIAYSVRLSSRAKRLRLAVYCDSTVLVTAPLGFSFFKVQAFIEEKLGWIIKTLKFFEPYKNRPVLKSSRREYKKYQLAASRIAQEKIEHWNKFYGFNFNRVNIKNQKSRWGSCSKKGNLNFNYKIIHLPERLQDYLVVHELCHLQEFNHCKNFWSLVAKAMPDYKNLRSTLRDYVL